MSLLPPPTSAPITSTTNQITPLWRSYIDEVYKVTGYSDGRIQFNGNTVQTKNLEDNIRLIPSNNVYIQNVKFPEFLGSINTVLTPKNNTEVEFQPAHKFDPNYTTGDIKIKTDNTVETGWLFMNDSSIGNALSNATALGDESTRDLYRLFWNNVAEAWAPVVGGRGSSADDDFDVGKALTMPSALGRALCVAGQGTSLTLRALGESLGEATHVLTAAETPAHTHDINIITDLIGEGNPTGDFNGTPATGAFGLPITLNDEGLIRAFDPEVEDYVGVFNQPHNNTQPTQHYVIMVKL